MFTNYCKSGVLLSIVGMDFERRLYPIVIGHFPSESEQCWAKLLEFLVASLPEYEPLLRARVPRESVNGEEDTESIEQDAEEVRQDESRIAFIADLGQGFAAAVAIVLPGAYVSHCIQHRKVRRDA
jgi:hypothetical protein